MSDQLALDLRQPKMTSLEIADLVESRHDTVKDSIKRLANRGTIHSPAMADIPYVDESGRNRNTKGYVFVGDQGKRDSTVVVAQLSPEFTARLVDRWLELEEQAKQAAKPQLPDFTNPAEAARAWASEYEQKQAALEKLEAAQPAIEFHERVAESGSLHSIDEVAKALRAPPKKFRDILKYDWQMYRQDRLPKQEFINRGYVRVVEKILPHTGKPYPQMFFTAKGFQWAQRRLDHSLLGIQI
jgi:phage regulator Rha-like protein